MILATTFNFIVKKGKKENNGLTTFYLLRHIS